MYVVSGRVVVALVLALVIVVVVCLGLLVATPTGGGCAGLSGVHVSDSNVTGVLVVDLTGDASVGGALACAASLITGVNVSVVDSVPSRVDGVLVVVVSGEELCDDVFREAVVGLVEEARGVLVVVGLGSGEEASSISMAVTGHCVGAGRSYEVLLSNGTVVRGGDDHPSVLVMRFNGDGWSITPLFGSPSDVSLWHGLLVEYAMGR